MRINLKGKKLKSINMVKVKFRLDYKNAKEGQVVEVPEIRAKQLIDQKIAVEVKDEKREKTTKEAKFVSVKEHKALIKRVEKLEKK